MLLCSGTTSGEWWVSHSRTSVLVLVMYLYESQLFTHLTVQSPAGRPYCVVVVLKGFSKESQICLFMEGTRMCYEETAIC